MSQKTFEKLIHVNYSDNYQVTTRMVFADFRDFQTPLGKLLNKALHGFGVASGLEVTIAANGDGVQVAAGVAVDRSGQLLVLSTGGAAVIGNQAPFTETTVPVVVPTDEVKGKRVVVCLQFNELSRVIIPLPGQTNDFPNGKLEQAPRVTLVPVTDFAESDSVVVLGIADVDADGKVTEVVSGTNPGRQRLGTSVGQLNIERPDVDGAKESTMGSLGPLPTGNGVQVTADLTATTGKLAIGHTNAQRALDVVGSVAVRQAAQGPELVVLSQTPSGAGGIETRDANNNRMAALTTAGNGTNQSGYLTIGTSSGVEVASVSASGEGAGRVQVQSSNGRPVVVVTSDGVSDNGLIKILSNSVIVMTLGEAGITSKGDVKCDGNIVAQSALLDGVVNARAGVQTDGFIQASGALIANGGVVGKAGLWTDGSVRAKGTYFSDGNMEAKGALIASGGAVGTAGLWTDGNVQAKGALIAAAGAVGTAGLWTDGNVQAKGALFATGGAVVAAGLWTDKNIQAKGTVFTDGQIQAKRSIFTDEQVVAKGDIFGKAKHFVMTHPEDATKDIVYGCVEGPEAAAYIRGRATLTNGKAWIELPDHFMLVVNPDTVTIQLTPRSAASKGLAALEFCSTGFEVQELFDGTGSYDIDYFVTGVRKGYENYQPVVDKGISPTANATQQMNGANNVLAAPVLANPNAIPQLAPLSTRMESTNTQPIPTPFGGTPGEKPAPWNIL